MPLKATSVSHGRAGPACIIAAASFACESALAASTGYLLVLLAAARSLAPALGASIPESDEPARLVVLIPAHDEEMGLVPTLASVASCSYPVSRLRTIVIADNCSDDTAGCARTAGVEVWERTDADRLGKGYALSWALDRLMTGAEEFDAVVMLDADCEASPNFLTAFDTHLKSGARAMQANYLAANPHDSHAAALRFGAFALMNTVRFLGKQRLGLSCGLVGTGMAFTKELLEREAWTATGLVEDAEYHMRIVLAGERAEFVPEAWVRSEVPTSLERSSDQHARWELGKLQLIRRWCPLLIASGIARRDVVRLHAGLECLVPPQSLMAAGSLAAGGTGLLLRQRRLTRLAAWTLIGQIVFVIGGFRLVRVPNQVYRALLVTPALIANKVALYIRLLARRGPTSWVRTERGNVHRTEAGTL